MARSILNVWSVANEARPLRCRLFACGLIWLVTAFNLVRGEPAGDEPVSSAGKVGTYDSRVIAYAHFWSVPHQQKLADLTRQARTARAAGQPARAAQLETELKARQDKIHLQVFSTASAEEAMEALKERLPAIHKSAGVTNLFSKWDEAALRDIHRSKRVDVTELLLQEFQIDDKRMRVARDLAGKKPLPIEKARRMVEQKKL